MKIYLVTKPPYDSPNENVIRFYKDPYTNQLYSFMTLEDYESLLSFVKEWSQNKLEFIVTSDVKQILQYYKDLVDETKYKETIESLKDLERKSLTKWSEEENRKAVNTYTTTTSITFFDEFEKLLRLTGNSPKINKNMRKKLERRESMNLEN